jgi:hypothetical protein
MGDKRKRLTPYQRIVLAAKRGMGCYLTARTCAHMARDEAIRQLAENDDEDDAEKEPSHD